MKRPARTVHVGRVEAQGYVIPNWVREPDARSRILRRWSPGDRVAQVGGNLVVVSRATESVLASASPGTPLVAVGPVEGPVGGPTLRQGLLVGAPMLLVDVAEALAAQAPQPTLGWPIVLVEGGDYRVPEGVGSTDPSEWLDHLWGPQVLLHEVEPLGEPAPTAVRLLPPAPTLRAVFGGKIPARDPASISVEAAIRRLQRGLPGATQRDRGDAPGLALRAGAAAGTLPWMLLALVASVARAFAWLARAQRARQKAGAGSAGTSSGLVVREVAPAGPGWLSGTLDRLHDALARLLVATRLAAWAGRRQAEYLSNLLDLFEDDDLEEALRRAIPLGDDGDPDEPSRLALGVPQRRTDLSISLQRGRGASMGLGEELFARMRGLYRKTVERLRTQERWEEAAFVLAELLGESAEAVALLEEHGELRRAAELAEARKLSPGVAIRLWMLADDLPRAVALARRTGAFADALSRMGTGARDRATATLLRLAWADLLADGGAYAEAAFTVQGIAEARALELAWLVQASQGSGVTSVRARLRLLALGAASFESTQAALLALLTGEGSGPDVARAVGRSLLEWGAERRGDNKVSLPDAAVRPLAQLTARALLVGLHQDPQAGLFGLARELAAYGGPSSLGTELSALTPSTIPRLLERSTPLVLAIEAADVGIRRIHDAAFLASGGFLLGLGDVGAELLDHRGRRLATFDVPCHRFALSPTHERAIANAPAGLARQLARIDLRSRRAERWALVDLQAWDDRFDGLTWIVCRRQELLLVDAVAAGFEPLQRIARYGPREEAVRIASDEKQVAVHTTELFVEKYDIPGYRLAGRQVVQADLAMYQLLPTGEPIFAKPSVGTGSDGADGGWTLSGGGEGFGAGSSLHAIAASTNFVATATHSGELTVRAFDRRDHKVRVEVRLAGAQRVSLRLGGDPGPGGLGINPTLTIADDRGRLLVLDLEGGAWLRNLRV